MLRLFLALSFFIMSLGVNSQSLFTPLEYQHVRVRGMFSLPSGGLEIDLDSLSGDFTYPILGKLISDYGMRRGRPHTGIDLKAMRGDTIRAVLPGVVRMSRLYSSYGNIVVLRHSCGLETVYSHNTLNLVSPDDSVSTGQPIALAGRTGRATTEHLHFEVRAAGEPIDPKLLVDPQTQTIRTGKLYITQKNSRIVAATSKPSLDEAVAVSDSLSSADSLARSQAVATSKSTQPTSSPKPVYHTVRRGEVLGTIARKYGTSISKITKLNNLKSPDKIREGQKLRIK